MELVTLELAQEVAVVTARKVHKKYVTYFDVADVTQELMLWVVTHNNKIEEWLGHEVDSEEFKVGVKKLGKTLTRQADKYCRKIKAQKVGYELRDEQFYSPTNIAEMLPFAWKDVVETRDATKPRVSGSTNPAEGGDYMVKMFDIRRALLKLNEYDRDVLELKFAQNLTYRELAEELEVSESTAHRKVDNAIRHVNNFLGGSNPYGKGETNANV